MDLRATRGQPAAGEVDRPDPALTAREGGRSFRPDVEGIRAVAILLVVAVPRRDRRAPRRLRRRRRLLRHLRVPDHRAARPPSSRGTGRISLPHFYARRARRLLPAAPGLGARRALATCAAAAGLPRWPSFATRRDASRRSSSSTGSSRPRPPTTSARRRALPGPALLVAVGGGAVLPRLAAAAHRCALRRRAGPARGAGSPRSCSASLALAPSLASLVDDRRRARPSRTSPAHPGLGVRRRRAAASRCRPRSRRLRRRWRPRRLGGPRC